MATHIDARELSATPMRSVGVAGRQHWLEISAFVIAVLAAQRFLLPPVSAFICVVPLALGLVYWNDPRLRNALILLALLAKVDSSEAAYLNTPGAIRAAINLAAIWAIVGQVSVARPAAIVALAFVGVLAVTTLGAIPNVDPYTFARDSITLVLAAAVLFTQRSDAEPLTLIPAAVAFSLGLCLAELVNIAVFFDGGGIDYLSYDSLKAAVCFASLYCFAKRRTVLGVALAAATLLVLTEYATRMLLLSYLVCIAMLVFGGSRSWADRLLALFAAMAAVVIGAALLEDTWVEGSRIFSLLIALQDSVDTADYIRLLDPVRFLEHQMFFGRDAVSILLGEGLGSGYHDRVGLFADIPYDSGAFSDRELNESRFFRLHDAWIFLGLRFGLPIVLVGYALVFRDMLASQPEQAWLGCATFLMLNNATFSIAGLVVTGLLAAALVDMRRKRCSGPPLREP